MRVDYLAQRTGSSAAHDGGRSVGEFAHSGLQRGLSAVLPGPDQGRMALVRQPHIRLRGSRVVSTLSRSMSGKILSTTEGTNPRVFTVFDWILFVSISLIWGSSG